MIIIASLVVIISVSIVLYHGSRILYSNYTNYYILHGYSLHLPPFDFSN
jgi:hypothetical protein